MLMEVEQSHRGSHPVPMTSHSLSIHMYLQAILTICKKYATLNRYSNQAHNSATAIAPEPKPEDPPLTA